MMTQFKVKTPMYVPGFMNAMDKMFSDDYQAMNQPAVNIVEKEKSYEITLMAPGLTKNDFTISVENDLLNIAFQKEENKSEETEKFIRKEFGIRSFNRSFTMSEKLDIDHISAVYENGLLNVSIPKAEAKDAKAKTIQVN
jgi:HSP20 family protein